MLKSTAKAATARCGMVSMQIKECVFAIGICYLRCRQAWFAVRLRNEYDYRFPAALNGGRRKGAAVATYVASIELMNCSTLAVVIMFLPMTSLLQQTAGIE